MPSRTVLPFKLASNDETLTAQSGSVLFREYRRALDFPGGGLRWCSCCTRVGAAMEYFHTLRANAGQQCLKVNREAVALPNTIRHRC